MNQFDCFRNDRPAQALNKTDVAKQQDAVVLLESPSGFGTGMIVDQRGYVLTCAHVLPYRGRMRVHFGAAGADPPGNLTEEAEVIAADHRHDLALLQFNPPDGIQLATVRLGIASEVKKAEEIVIVGNPGIGAFVLDKTVLLGTVSNKRQQVGQFVKRPHVQLSANVWPGCSGGPAFNLFGDVIGVVNQQAAIPKTGFAIPMDVVAGFLGTADRSDQGGAAP